LSFAVLLNKGCRNLIRRKTLAADLSRASSPIVWRNRLGLSMAFAGHRFKAISGLVRQLRKHKVSSRKRRALHHRHTDDICSVI